MTYLQDLINKLPDITTLNQDDMKKTAVYIGAIGFEDRSLSVLKNVLDIDRKLKTLVLIDYEPYNENNKKSEFNKIISQLRIDSRNLISLTYDRYNPEKFIADFARITKRIKTNQKIMLDISAMSKFLIVLLMQELCNTYDQLQVVYAEAKTYHPTKTEFEKKKKEKNLTPPLPVFLTTDVYKIVTTRSLSSYTMQGYPLLLVAFPTFNHREIVAILNEIMPHKLIAIIGKPHNKADNWRLDAVKYINKNVEDYINVEEKVVSTFEYVKTIQCLDEIYKEYSDTHKIIIAPTGSKFQSLAVFLFKQMHPDVQIVYPVTREYAEDYTKGCKALWKIEFDNLQSTLNILDSYRKSDLADLKKKIDTASNL